MNNLYRELKEVFSSVNTKVYNRREFLRRLKQGNLTRDENKDTHFCVYFAAFDSKLKQVFIGLHKKSGLWLFNGGHIDKGEILDEAIKREMGEEWGFILPFDANTPSLATFTKIAKPSKTPCLLHYDIWYFVPVDRNTFHPNPKKLAKEFFENRWVSINEASRIIIDSNTIKALGLINSKSFI